MQWRCVIWQRFEAYFLWILTKVFLAWAVRFWMSILKGKILTACNLCLLHRRQQQQKKIKLILCCCFVLLFEVCWLNFSSLSINPCKSKPSMVMHLSYLIWTIFLLVAFFGPAKLSSYARFSQLCRPALVLFLLFFVANFPLKRMSAVLRLIAHVLICQP